MKKIVLLIMLFPALGQAQQGLDIRNFQQSQTQISQAEMRMHGHLQEMGQMQDSFTVASDNFDIHHIRFEWNLDPAVKYIRGKISFAFTMLQTGHQVELDMSRQLKADSVLYHGIPVSFQQTTDNGLQIQLPADVPAQSADSFSVYYQGVPDASGFGSFYQGTHSGVPVVWTLSEPYGARDWWPCKNGLNDKADSIDIFISYPNTYVASSNGKLVEQFTAGSLKTDHFKSNYPIATYLVALAITNYKLNRDTLQINGKPLEYIGYYYPTSYADFSNYDRFAKQTIVLFSELFGEYPFMNDKYSQTQFGWGGGMEHQTNSFIGSRGPNLQVHELMHQWFGDMITCGSWHDIWLNEGFATYGVLLMLEKLYPDYYASTLYSTLLSATSVDTGSVYVRDTSSEARIFSSALSYNKGAYVLHMLRWVLGDSAYFRGIRRYASDPAVRFGYAFTGDLKRNLEAESGRNLDSFFRKWVYGEGYPNYQVNWSENNNHWVRIALNQTTTSPTVSFFDMPVELLLQGSGQEKRVVVNHQYSGQEFWIDAGFAVDTVIIDPDMHILSLVKISTRQLVSSTNNLLTLYPNPAPGPAFLSLKNPTDSKLYIRLYNSTGQLVWKQDAGTDGRDEIFPLSLQGLARGTYVLRVSSEKSIRWTQKLLH